MSPNKQYPLQVLQILGLQHLEFNFFRVFLAALDQQSLPTSKEDTLKLLQEFFSEKLISKNVHLKQLAFDLCTLIPEPCIRGAKCLQNVTGNGELDELIGYKTSFIVPVVISRAELVFPSLIK